MKHDVVIAGAGLTGRLMALALAHEGIGSTIIDPATAQTARRDGRTTAIAYASARLFKRLGLWDELDAKAGAITDILVTNGRPSDRFRRGGVSGGALHFPSSLLPDDRTSDGGPLGFIVENADMNALFEKHVDASDLVTTRYGEWVVDAQEAEGGVTITTDAGDAIDARLLIACDGKASPLRKSLGFDFIEWPYDQHALVFNIEHSANHNGVAHEIFLPGGPFAILPMAGQQSSIVWTEKSAMARTLMALTPDQLLTEAQNRIGPLLGSFSLSSAPACFPLKFGYAPNLARGRTVLAGDAAHTIHPIAGQGFNLGVKDIAALTEVVSKSNKAGLDIGHGAVLDEYAAWRRFDSAAMSFGTDALNRLFSNDIAPVRWARSLGLGLVQKIDPLRVAFMRQSGADTGKLPALMRPM